MKNSRAGGGRAMRLIDADALMKVIREHDYPLRSHFNSTDNGMFTIGVQQAVDDAPTIDAVPMVRGEWKRGREFSSYPRVPFIGDAYYCSNCEEEAYWDTDYGQQLFGFCPNCGAKMEASNE
jgi:hypothetical protein